MMGFSEFVLYPMNVMSNLFSSLIGLLVLIFMVWMIIDCVLRKFRNNVEKVLWVVLIIFTNWVGALIYFIVIRNMKTRGVAK